jgi:hypothetical protein
MLETMEYAQERYRERVAQGLVLARLERAREAEHQGAGVRRTGRVREAAAKHLRALAARLTTSAEAGSAQPCAEPMHP